MYAEVTLASGEIVTTRLPGRVKRGFILSYVADALQGLTPVILGNMVFAPNTVASVAIEKDSD